MANITYLLGAGASAGCLPVVGKISERITIMRADVKRLIDPPGAIYDNDTQRAERVKFESSALYKNASLFIKELDWLKSEASKHATIDTLAKKYYLIHNTNYLNRLKIALSTFFTLIQCTNMPDGRYDSLLAGLLNRELQIPSNIKFITWNYDIQMELAGMQYFQKVNVNDMQVSLSTYPRAGLIENGYNPNIVHLNGTAGFYNSGNSYSNLYREINNYANSTDILNSFRAIDFVFDSSKNESLDFSKLMCFSWEQSEVSRKAIEYASIIMANTEILVIIGYSFPFFNRPVDRPLLNSAINLNKIYYQDPKINGNFLTQQFNLKVPIEHVPEVDQFFIPHEL